MKILQVSVGYYPPIGGVAQHVLNISSRLAKNHDVTVFTQNFRNRFSEDEVIEGVRIRRFRSFSPDASYHISPEMIRELRKSRFDIVHGHNYHALPLYFAPYAGSEAFVVTPHYHGHGHTPLRNLLLHLYKYWGKQIFRKADVVLPVSQYEKKLLMRDFRINEEKMHLIPNGINKREFAGSHIIPKTNNILYVGRLEKYKGVQHIIEALQLVDARLHLEIVGRGTYEGELKRLASKLAVSDRINFNGFISRQELMRKYAEASLLVLLSQSEAFSIVVAEALAARVPCIVANTSALWEWVDDTNCFGIDYPIEARKLAEMINRSAGKKVGNVGLWDWDDVVRELEKIYQQVLH